MIGLPQLKARIARLDRLEGGLVAELKAWENAESPLPPGEREQYLDAALPRISSATQLCHVLTESHDTRRDLTERRRASSFRRGRAVGRELREQVPEEFRVHGLDQVGDEPFGA
jgi:hypothetical protein